MPWANTWIKVGIFFASLSLVLFLNKGVAKESFMTAGFAVFFLVVGIREKVKGD